MAAVLFILLSTISFAADGYYGNLGRTIEKNGKKIAGELNSMQEDIIELKSQQQPEKIENKPADAQPRQGEISQEPATEKQSDSR